MKNHENSFIEDKENHHKEPAKLLPPAVQFEEKELSRDSNALLQQLIDNWKHPTLVPQLEKLRSLVK